MMKKLLVALFGLTLAFGGVKTIGVYADGESSEVSSEVVEEVESSEKEEVSSEVEDKEDAKLPEIELDEDEKEWIDKVADVLGDVFDAKTVSIITMVLGYVIALVKLVSAVNKARKEKNCTLEDVKEVVLKEVEGRVDDSVKNNVEVGVNAVYKTCTNMNEVLKVLAKVMCLSQENTPESRLAILECISQLGVIEKEITDNSKNVVETQVREEAEYKENTLNKIEEMKKVIDDGTSI